MGVQYARPPVINTGHEIKFLNSYENTLNPRCRGRGICVVKNHHYSIFLISTHYIGINLSYCKNQQVPADVIIRILLCLFHAEKNTQSVNRSKIL